MTKPGDNSPSNFDARADNAALALRQTLQRQGREVPDRAPVEVGADGRPPAPLPPEGSYARQAIELEKRRQAQQQPPQQVEQPVQQPPAPQPPPQAQAGSDHSPRAEQRIQELVGQLRERDRQLQEALEMGRRAHETAQQFESRVRSLETERQQMLEANLDSLDPDTRAQVLTDARVAQRMDEIEQRIMGRFQPKLQHLESKAEQADLVSLSHRYPGFDYQTHAPLIAAFRSKNPNCSIEQAFRAVAEPEELSLSPSTRAQAVPPIVPPGNGELAVARFAPQSRQQQQPHPEDELVEESRRIAELRRSTDPAKQKEGLRLADEHLRRRLSGR